MAAGRTRPVLPNMAGGVTTGVMRHQLAHLEANVEAVDTKALVSQTRGGAAAAAPQKSSMAQTLKVGSFFFLWYFFNIGYNIYNKKALNALPLPWTVGLVQLSLGLLYVFPLWLTGLRKVSSSSMSY